VNWLLVKVITAIKPRSNLSGTLHHYWIDSQGVQPADFYFISKVKICWVLLMIAWISISFLSTACTTLSLTVFFNSAAKVSGGRKPLIIVAVCLASFAGGKLAPGYGERQGVLELPLSHLAAGLSLKFLVNNAILTRSFRVRWIVDIKLIW